MVVGRTRLVLAVSGARGGDASGRWEGTARTQCFDYYYTATACDACLSYGAVLTVHVRWIGLTVKFWCDVCCRFPHDAYD